mmetsp:Transcript_13209/g.55316  ORF Transcript_13209/g.55316 Transcript_13209/m.55316 type:complete len:260 (-) Transcript_13209:3132-3911(-)
MRPLADAASCGGQCSTSNGTPPASQVAASAAAVLPPSTVSSASASSSSSSSSLGMGASDSEPLRRTDSMSSAKFFEGDSPLPCPAMGDADRALAGCWSGNSVVNDDEPRLVLSVPSPPPRAPPLVSELALRRMPPTPPLTDLLAFRKRPPKPPREAPLLSAPADAPTPDAAVPLVAPADSPPPLPPICVMERTEELALRKKPPTELAARPRRLSTPAASMASFSALMSISLWPKAAMAAGPARGKPKRSRRSSPPTVPQ